MKLNKYSLLFLGVSLLFSCTLKQENNTSIVNAKHVADTVENSEAKADEIYLDGNLLVKDYNSNGILDTIKLIDADVLSARYLSIKTDDSDESKIKNLFLGKQK